MKTAEEREAEFREELSALLKKHGAELNVKEVSEYYYDVEAIVVSLPNIYDDKWNVVSGHFDFRL
jgi:hypothetical protein